MIPHCFPLFAGVCQGCSSRNSPNVIHKHCKGLVKEAEATEFWSITPETVKSEIVKVPAQVAA